MFGGAPNPLVAAIKAQKSPRSDTDEVFVISTMKDERKIEIIFRVRAEAWKSINDMEMLPFR